MYVCMYVYIHRLKDMTGEQNSKVVQGLIQQLGLVKARHTEIGDARAAGTPSLLA
jgi:hypothetical protein